MVDLLVSEKKMVGCFTVNDTIFKDRQEFVTTLFRNNGKFESFIISCDYTPQCCTANLKIFVKNLVKEYTYNIAKCDKDRFYQTFKFNDVAVSFGVPNALENITLVIRVCWCEDDCYFRCSTEHTLKTHLCKSRYKDCSIYHPFLKPLKADSYSILHYEPPDKPSVCYDHAKLNRYLAHALFKSDSNHRMMIDWTYCLSHPLIFDINIKGGDNGQSTYEVLMRYFDLVFLNALQKHLDLPDITILLSMRRHQTGGMHVHILGVELAHDDYVHLCHLMRRQLQVYREDGFTVTLNCPWKMCLVACDKRKGQGGLYVPVRLVRARFENYYCERDRVWKSRRMDQLFFSHEPKEQMVEVAEQMSPVPGDPNNVIHVAFVTHMVPGKCRKNQCIAQFTYCVNGGKYAIAKGTRLGPSRGDPSFCYRFLKEKNLTQVNSIHNRAFKRWYKQFSCRAPIDGMFRSIDRKLRENCLHLKDARSPLGAILSNPDCVLPAFYALCNMLWRKNPARICKAVYALVPDAKAVYQGVPNAQKLPAPTASMRHLSMNALLHLAFHTNPKLKEDVFYKNLEQGWDSIFESTTTRWEMRAHVRFLQKRFYPFVRGRRVLYGWSPLVQNWTMINPFFKEEKIELVVREICSCMESFQGFCKLPVELQNLKDNSDWMEYTVREILKELEKSKIIEGYVKKSEFCGMNVPEYYFFF